MPTLQDVQQVFAVRRQAKDAVPDLESDHESSKSGGRSDVRDTATKPRSEPKSSMSGV